MAAFDQYAYNILAPLLHTQYNVPYNKIKVVDIGRMKWTIDGHTDGVSKYRTENGSVTDCKNYGNGEPMHAICNLFTVYTAGNVWGTTSTIVPMIALEDGDKFYVAYPISQYPHEKPTPGTYLAYELKD